MIFAVGDISGKGISSALMMATIHSAVRAYSIEGIPLFCASCYGAGARPKLGLCECYVATMLRSEVSRPSDRVTQPSTVQSTPDSKYATFFLGIYDSETANYLFQWRPPAPYSSVGGRFFSTSGLRRIGGRPAR